MRKCENGCGRTIFHEIGSICDICYRNKKKGLIPSKKWYE